MATYELQLFYTSISIAVGTLVLFWFLYQRKGTYILPPSARLPNKGMPTDKYDPSTSVNIFVFLYRMTKYLITQKLKIITQESNLDQALYIYIFRIFIIWYAIMSVPIMLAIGVWVGLKTGVARIAFSRMVAAKDMTFVDTSLLTVFATAQTILMLLMVLHIRRVIGRCIMREILQAEAETSMKRSSLWFEIRTLFISGIPGSDHDGSKLKQALDRLIGELGLDCKVEQVLIIPALSNVLNIVKSLKNSKDM